MTAPSTAADFIPERPAAHRVLVVGAGIGGLTAATALARKGISVELVEIKSVVAGLGVGLGLGSNALAALREIGVDRASLDVGAHFDRIELYDEHETPITEHVFDRDIDDYPPFCALPRSTLHAILLAVTRDAGVKIVVDDSPLEITDADDAVRVTFTSGREPGNYDAVIGFDGIRSTVRRLLFGDEHEPTYTGYGVWRARIARPPSLLYQRKYLGPQGRPGIGLMPISESEAYLSYVRPEPEGHWYQPEVFVPNARSGLEGYTGELAELRESIKDPGAIVFSPLETVEVPAPWSRGRVAIAGDAAHAAVPHLTQGAAMAIEDAIVLAHELAKNQPVEQAFATYVDKRYARVNFVQQLAWRILEAEQSHAHRHHDSSAEIGESFRKSLEIADGVLGKILFETAYEIN